MINRSRLDPFSVTTGAVLSVFLLFACAGGGGKSSSAPPPGGTQVTTQFSIYADNAVLDETRGIPWRYSYSLGIASTDMVITDFARTGSFYGSRLVVDGVPVYVIPSGTASMSLMHGIQVPRGAVVSIESEYDSMVWSVAGYSM